jgi:protein disulfide-isomerase
MKTLLTLAVATTITLTASAGSWLTDIKAAQDQARGQNKLILVNFTGSDWSQESIRLKNEVFSKPEFASFAGENLVLLEVDFPRQKPMSPEVRKANGKLADHYKVAGGYPSVHVLDADGQSLGQTGYLPGGPNPFVAKIKAIAGDRLQPKTVAQAAPQQPQEPRPTPTEETPEAPAFNGAPTFEPKVYADLELKGISGKANARFALINNQTIGAGESANVKVGDSIVKVKCLEIHPDYVVVSVDGTNDRRELRLRGGL